MLYWSKYKLSITLTLSEFKILNVATLRIENWLVCRILAKIFHNLNIPQKIIKIFVWSTRFQDCQIIQLIGELAARSKNNGFFKYAKIQFYALCDFLRPKLWWSIKTKNLLNLIDWIKNFTINLFNHYKKSFLINLFSTFTRSRMDAV